MHDVTVLPAPGASFFTPAQVPPAGVLAPSNADTPLPTLFQPIKIRGVKFHNRIFVSPMGMGSADRNGCMTNWHIAMLGAKILHGPGLTMVEATAVTPEGRVSTTDGGLWADEQIAGLRAVVDFAHSQNQKLGVQLGHAGRKASVAPLWLGRHAVAPESQGGWPQEIVAPSPIMYKEGGEDDDEMKAQPRQLKIEEIGALVQAWVDAAKRAVAAEVDVIEIHAGHGMLLHEFLSPITNKRTDAYGGSFDNRSRVLVEIVDAVRKAIPETMPLFVRLSATDWLEKVLPDEPSWRTEDTVRLAGVLADHGVDLIDVSSGGLDSRQKIEFAAPAYQAHFAEAVKKAVGDRVLVGTVGGIKTGHLAQEVLDKQQADVVLVGKQFLKDPACVVTFAEQLGVDIKLPHQIDWVVHGRGSAWRWTAQA